MFDFLFEGKPWVYALLAVASWLFAYYLVPETKGRTLEEIEHSFRHRHAA